MFESIVKTFTEKYNTTPRIFRSPGRVNIIGEHTDYNEGFVLPGAINKHIWVGIGKRNDNKINLFASDFNELHSFDVTTIQRSSVQWTNYILGVVDQLQKAGYTLTGFNLVIDGDVPVGAGLSSSAAVECAVIYALNELFALHIDKLKMVHMAQKAEHTFAGVQCGIMDQFASMMGKKDHVIKLDCRSLSYEYIPCNLEGYKIVLFNSNVKHNLASTEYNVRRQQCEQGVHMLQQFYPEIKSLRDVNMKMLDEHIAVADPLIYQRCKYVVEENARLLMACDYLTKGNIPALGKKIFESHEGLSKDYEVSCKELDFLVDLVKINPAVAGARMMGGGFGGCTINLVKEDAIEKLIDSVKMIYEKETRLPLTSYIAEIDNGTSEVN
ncbi:MAG: galactokinase [Bacteroidetes bacterium]|nr:galactokinase [Bacteroidota bacterium]